MRTALFFMGCSLVLSGPSHGCSLIGDFNGDCRVGMDDLVLMAAQWMAPSACGSEAGLVAYWKLDETSGLLAADASGSGRTGGLAGASWNPLGGMYRGALQFDGINDYMYVNGYQGISGSNPRTCTAWIKTDRPAGEIMSWGDRDLDTGRWVVWVDDTGVLRVDVGGGHIFGTTVLTDDFWHHIAVTSDGSTTDQITLYVDGKIETVAEIVSQPIDTHPRATVKLGVFQLLYSAGCYFDGWIDDARIYNRVLSLQEIWSIAKTATTDYACADMNMDATVNLADAARLSQSWMQEEPLVTIGEFLADNESKSPLGPGEILDGNGESSDWIEIHNNSRTVMDISGYYLSDDSDLKTKWQFPAGNAQLVLQPGAYLIVFASGKTQAQNPGNYPYVDPAGYWHTNFSLSASGEYLGLFAADGVTPMHEYNHINLGGQYGYPEQAADISYGYYYDEARYFSVPTPGADNVRSPFEEVVERPEVNIKGGCYYDAVDVTLSCGTDGAFIQYTTDGTVPSLTNGMQYAAPIHLDSITTLLAKAFKPGLQSSDTRIETYIFVEPDISPSNTNLPIVVVDTLGVSIPSDQINKPYIDCRVVIVDTDKATGRAEITGPEHFEGWGMIRRRGESTYNNNHYALEIQDEYRQDNAVSLLGMPAESDWILSWDALDYTMMKNEMAFKWFRGMGHYAPRQRYVEVYLNTGGGNISSEDYVGLFILREKIKRDANRVDIARLDASHNLEPKVSGGYIIKNDKEDTGDVLLVGLETAPYGIVLDGVTSIVEPGPLPPTSAQITWIADYMNEFHSVLWQNTASSYYVPGSVYTDYVEETSWIDHCIVEEIGFDADAFRFSYFIHKDRNGKLCSGPPWDFDRAFHNNDGSYGLSYTGWDRVYKLPWAWNKQLMTYPEYALKFADRWFEHREKVLNTDLTMAYIDQTKALISEARSRPKKTYPKPFDEEIELFKTWITNRLDFMDGYIAGHFAEKPPMLTPAGGYVSQGSSVAISLPSGASGTIYYTVNGQDPRLEGGAINPNAVSGSSVTLNKSTCLKARIKDGSSWSAMNTEVYAVGPVLENLRISELMYHPSDPTPAEITAVGDPNLADDDFEFIELTNTGGTALNLNLVHFTDGIDFTFGDYTLAAGAYAVLVKNQAAFAARYNTAGLAIVPGSYLGSLDNDGEEIVLRDALGAEIHDFDYKDGWYDLTDGAGFSLTMVNPASTDPNLWDTKVGWRSSLYTGGTPGGVDMVLAAGSIVINELMSHSHGTDPDWIELYNTTSQNIDIGGWFLSDRNNDDPNIMKYEIPSGTEINAHSYLVFVEDVTFGNPSAPGCHTPFGLSEAGETVYLYSGQSGQVTGYYQTEENFDASETGVSFGRYEKAELSGGYDFVRQSSPSQGTVNNGPLIPDIVMTEIYYNPPAGGAYEFVELYNRSGNAVTLMSDAATETSPGVFVTQSIPWRLEGTGYEFPANTSIPAQTRILVAKTPSLYSSAPCAVYGPYDGALDNGGEQLEIQIPGDQEYGQSRYWIPIEKVDYDDVAPWPTSADGGGHSLHRLNANTYGRDYSNWSPAAPTPGS